MQGAGERGWSGGGIAHRDGADMEKELWKTDRVSPSAGLSSGHGSSLGPLSRRKQRMLKKTTFVLGGGVAHL